MEQEKQLTLIEHLEELRLAIIHSLVCLLILFPVGYYLSHYAIVFLKDLCPELNNLYYIHILGLFFTRMKLGFIIAIILGSPYITFKIWNFISPGLYSNERFYIACFTAISTFFFIVGASVAIFFVFPMLVKYATSTGQGEIKPLLDVEYFINLICMMILGFGLVFQLPVVIFILVSTGFVSPELISKNRPFIYIGIFVIAAVLTPPDIFSQVAMGVPASILFELSFTFAKFARRRKTKRKPKEPDIE